MKLKYTDEQIQRAAKGLKWYKEEEQNEEPEKKEKHFKTFTIGDDKIDVDILHGFIYINDELVTADTDIPKKVIKILQEIIPKIANGDEKLEHKEEE